MVMQKTAIMRLTARILAAVWTLFWMYFGLASGIGENLDVTGIIIHTLSPGGVFLLFFLIALKFERIGGVIFMLIGIIVAIAYPLTFGKNFPVLTSVLVILTMAIPPLAAGVLLFWSNAVKTA